MVKSIIPGTPFEIPPRPRVFSSGPKASKSRSRYKISADVTLSTRSGEVVRAGGADARGRGRSAATGYIERDIVRGHVLETNSQAKLDPDSMSSSLAIGRQVLL